MVIAGTYEHVRNENFVAYLTSMGVPEDRAKEIDSSKPKLEVSVDGRKVSLNNHAGTEKASLSTWILDEEVDEPMPNNVTLKSTAKLNGDTLTIRSKSPTGRITVRIYEFSASELVVKMSDEAGGPTGKRIFKKI